MKTRFTGDKNLTQYDLLAKEFEEADRSPDVTRPFLYSYLPHDLSGKKILDLGCGYGADLVYFSSKGAKVYGIDESYEQVMLAKKNCPGAKVKVAKNEHLPYEDESLEIVFSRYAIQHSENIDPIFREVQRVLKPQGNFIFLVTHPFRQYFEKPTRDYWKREIITSKILGGRLVVYEYSHTLEDYLNSPILRRKFTLENIQSEKDPAAEQKTEFGKYPDVMILHYRKF